METISQTNLRYRQIIQELLARFASIPNLEEELQDRLLFDEERDSYAIISEGWSRNERIHDIILHLEIINGKIWIQADNTDWVIARQLESKGVPKSDIVLGFRAPSVRADTEYAVA